MNTELFIARRITTGTKSTFSRPIVVIAIISIALSLSVMFLSIVILSGFQKEIRDKVIGFGGHIHITAFEGNQSYEPTPVDTDQKFLAQLRQMKGIRHVQCFGTKAGILRTDDQIQGIVLKGIGSDYDWSFFQNKIKEGKPFQVTDSSHSNEVIVSRKLCNLMKLNLNDDLRAWFVSGNQVRGRKFTISGIYETGLGEFDDVYILCDIHHIRRLNQWKENEVGGFEILIDDFDHIDQLGKQVYQSIGFSLDATTITQLYPQIFDWLSLQDINVLIILILMILVAGITMISTLLILILERTNTIGILKALGMPNGSLRKVFLLQSLFITGLGLIIGNIIGFGVSWLQMEFGLVTLPQESYYMAVVPIYINSWHIFLLNGITLVVCYLMMLIPSMIVARITPIKAIRFR